MTGFPRDSTVYQETFEFCGTPHPRLASRCTRYTSPSATGTLLSQSRGDVIISHKTRCSRLFDRACPHASAEQSERLERRARIIHTPETKLGKNDFFSSLLCRELCFAVPVCVCAAHHWSHISTIPGFGLSRQWLLVRNYPLELLSSGGL